MAQRRLKLTLWLLLAATIPLPYQLADREWAPALRLVFLTAITALLHLSEGFGGNLWAILLALGIVQSALYLLLLYGLAALTARHLSRRASPRLAVAVVAALAATLLATAAAFPLYVTPISSRHMYSSLFDVLR